MATTIIFLCPHAAAKSVAAAAFLTREAGERGLSLQISTAGTHPDPDILPIVRARLEMEGLPVHEPPRKVTDEDLSAADMIVNIGCDHDDLPTPRLLPNGTFPISASTRKQRSPRLRTVSPTSPLNSQRCEGHRSQRTSTSPEPGRTHSYVTRDGAGRLPGGGVRAPGAFRLRATVRASARVPK